MNKFLVYHQECPKSVTHVAPRMVQISRPRDPSIKLDSEFAVLQCQLCGLEISVRWVEPGKS